MKLTTSFARRGLVAEFGAPWFLERIIGHANALDLLLSARTIEAEEARELGLVNWVVDARRRRRRGDRVRGRPRDELLADRDGGDQAAGLRRLVPDGGTTSEDEWRRLVAQPHRKRDFREGVASYVERRPPRFNPYTGATVTQPDWPEPR